MIAAGSLKTQARLNPARENLKAVRVLLIEDSLPVRERVRSLIEESTPVKIVGEAGTVDAALALFHAHRPDAVVLDLSLSDGDGSSVLAGIKLSRPDCVVIVLTNFTIPESRKRCLKLGADYFFDKSREFERVPEVIGKLCRARSSDKI
ncbi:MAG: response regulator transcription factor [Verrucomicrobia bacterium]|nr:response regulator transcription factor [Verrucomicrobiota bacterium]